MLSDMRPTRMCSCCRKPIAAGVDSLTLNGMFAHTPCVEAVMREPGSMAVVTDLRLVTDDQLRAETCPSCSGPVVNGAWLHAGDCVLMREQAEKDQRRALGFFTDDQLRAECELRGIGHVSEPMCTVAERDRDDATALAAAINTPPDPARVEAIRPSFTLVQTVSRNLTMPECGDSCEWRGARYVCMQADYTKPGEPVLRFVKSSAPAPQRAADHTVTQIEGRDAGHWVDPLDLLADDSE